MAFRDDGNSTELLVERINENEKKHEDTLGDIYVGTSGYNYTHWRNGVFYPRAYPQSKELKYYSGVFPSVEINSSFHAIPPPQNIERWNLESQNGFQFSFKAPKEITHVHKLSPAAEPALLVFLARLNTNSDKKSQNTPNYNNSKLGSILFQLPPTLTKDVSRIHWVAQQIAKAGISLHTGNGDCKLRIAFEFRHSSWYCEDLYKALGQYNFVVCENISPDDWAIRIPSKELFCPSPNDWSYVRFHKNVDRDITNYTYTQLEREAEHILKLSKIKKEIYIYFMNDHEGNSTRNAQTLMDILSIKKKTQPQQRCLDSNTQKISNFSCGIRSHVKNWKPQPVIQKGGKGSIQYMFATMKKKNNERELEVSKIPPSHNKSKQSFFSSTTIKKESNTIARKPKQNKKVHKTKHTLSIDSFFLKKK